MLKGKTALVTGSTSGIGLAIAHALAREGTNIMLNGFGDKAEIEKIRAGTEKDFGVKARYSAADMTKPAEIADMIRTAEKEFGTLDVLVNNAGTCDDTPGPRWASRPSPVLHSRHIPAPHREAMPGAAANQPQSHPEVRHAAYAPL